MRSFLTRYLLFITILMFTCNFSKAEPADSTAHLIYVIAYPDSSQDLISNSLCNAELPLISDSSKSHAPANKKFIAAVLAFPLPFGILGLHRIYLGTKPYMPFAYIGTIGGCFGILPLIDFIAILATKKENLNRFAGNPKVFMWAH